MTGLCLSKRHWHQFMYVTSDDIKTWHPARGPVSGEIFASLNWYAPAMDKMEYGAWCDGENVELPELPEELKSHIGTCPLKKDTID